MQTKIRSACSLLLNHSARSSLKNQKEGPRTEWYGDNTEVADQIKKQMEMSAGMGKQMAGDAGADAGEISGADAGSAGESTEKNSDE